MEQVFKALAAATRRQMLDRLLETPGLTLSQLVEDLNMTRQSATRHLAVLEQAELVATIWEGREKRHYLNPLPIAEIGQRWIDKFSKQQINAIRALKRALEESS